ncbi:VOC family protein [Mastigocoleus testarum]|uniref:Bleomycin resistance protein n=1 Tax=Mastigocoleus testarum BC008 TaxID=371196 RepID=A0A0V7ZP62_9CYAN|nr:VOC family protein [Mastigocoleus testarum]KST66377.1 bleomycin resistance protein [Mastigocoleus testarum BC008]KST66698.1 bleomycin resistance protein [Mastigocoleus testarum BC008]
MVDRGITHIALAVKDVDASISFYQKYANVQVVHRRSDSTTQSDVAWIGDSIHPFVIVLIGNSQVKSPLLPESHIGVVYETREQIDRLCKIARTEGILIKGPTDSPPPVGYWAYIQDPDNHTLEISYGQNVESVIKS